MRWRLSHGFDQIARRMADDHYNRQSHGSPQFVPPAPRIVLLTHDSRALWVTTAPKFADHAWPGAWICTIFRNEGADLSSELIREAVACTRWRFGAVPAHGLITFVDESKVRRKRDPGRCFLRAGFVRLEQRTKVNRLIVLQMTESAMPPAEPPIGAQAARLF